MQGATPKPELQNMRYTNHQFMTKIFQFLQKSLGITADYSRPLNFFDGSIKNKCVDMGNVHVLVDESSQTSWAELLGKPGGLQEHELRGD